MLSNSPIWKQLCSVSAIVERIFLMENLEEPEEVSEILMTKFDENPKNQHLA